MHIALISPSRLPVKGYGGTERVIVWLIKGLAELGVQVTLLAPGGSTSPFARIVPINLAPGRERLFDPRPQLPPGVDLIHAHFPLNPVADFPLRWTLHGNTPNPQRLPPGAIGLSANHAARHGLHEWVYNGLDPEEYLFSPVKQDWDLFLGRLHAVKGWRWAVDGARKAGRSLVVAGGWRPSWRASLHFKGGVQGREKLTLLANAAALWAPAQWEEPFGLTTIEAMVSGTPVLGTPRGALPEIVTAESGGLGGSIEELAELRPELARLDPEAIRANVLSRFSYLTMAEAYRRIYQAVSFPQG